MRLPDLSDEMLTPEQREVHNMIARGPRTIVEGPLRVWLYSPPLAERAQELGAYCRFGSSLPPRLSELAILVTACFWRAEFEWQVHAPIGLAAGLAEKQLEDLRTGCTPSFDRRDEQAVYDFTNALLTQRSVPAVTYAQAEAALGQRGLVDLVGILGYYGLISMTINAFEVAPVSGQPLTFE